MVTGPWIPDELFFTSLITDANPLDPADTTSLTPDPADLNNPAALDPIEDNVFFTPELVDDNNPPAVFPTLWTAPPVEETAEPTVFPAVFTPDERVFPVVVTPDPTTFDAVLIVFIDPGPTNPKAALYVLPVALKKFWPARLRLSNFPGVKACDGEACEGEAFVWAGEFATPGALHKLPLQELHGFVDEQQDVHLGKTGGTIWVLRI